MTTTLAEHISIELSRTGRPTRAQLKLAREFDKDIVRFSKQFSRELLKVLNKFGREVERAAVEVLDRQKDAGQDAMDATLIVESMDLAGIEADLAKVYEANYTRIIRATDRRTRAVMDIGISIIDETEAQILATTTERVGLLDFSKRARRDIFVQLGAGRLEGESVVQLARRIRDFVPAGRFKKSSTRALLIARTETTHAQKMAASAGYRDSGVTEVMILDNRLGTADLGSDPECILLNGKIVTLEVGNALMSDEHPNGTRRMVAMPPPIVEGVE